MRWASEEHGWVDTLPLYEYLCVVPAARESVVAMAGDGGWKLEARSDLCFPVFDFRREGRRRQEGWWDAAWKVKWNDIGISRMQEPAVHASAEYVQCGTSTVPQANADR